MQMNLGVINKTIQCYKVWLGQGKKVVCLSSQAKTKND